MSTFRQTLRCLLAVAGVVLAAPATSAGPTWHGDQETVVDCGWWSWSEEGPVPTDRVYDICFEDDPDFCYTDVLPGDLLCLPEQPVGFVHRVYVVASSVSGGYSVASASTETYRAPFLDYNGDFVNSLPDLFIWIGWWDGGAGAASSDLRLDANEDGVVNLGDLFAIIPHFFKCLSENGVVQMEC